MESAVTLPSDTSHTALTITRDEHNVSRKDMSASALKVLYRLKDADYQAYMVGGCVRDLLLGKLPKDFDVATDATPEEIKEQFRNCRIIGRRFRLAHILFGREIIEVATFRGSGEENAERRTGDDGQIVRDNVFGSIEEDAWRRDFTVNGLYYDIRDFSIVDYVGGYQDLQDKVLRLIGDPATRYTEDPVRMLRAARFAAKLDFHIDIDTAEPIFTHGHLLEGVPAARLFEELLKLFHNAHAVDSFTKLQEYNLLQYLLPATAKVLEEDESWLDLFYAALRNTDERITSGKSITPAFLLAVTLWPVALRNAKGNSDVEMAQAFSAAIYAQTDITTIPKRLRPAIREIWQLQKRLENRRKADVTLSHPRFRAAYDFYLLRAETGTANPEIAQWWTDYQEAKPDQRRQMAPKNKRRRPRKKNAKTE